jgi:DNA primase
VPQYILERGIALETCKVWSLGYDRRAGRVFFPVFDEKRRFVGAVGGLINRVPNQPKYKNYYHKVHAYCGWPLEHKDGEYYCFNCGGSQVAPSMAQDGFKKSKHLYGAWMFPSGATAVVVEGLVDTLKVYQAVEGWSHEEKFFPVGLFGSKSTEEQANLIVRLTGNKVISFLDDDEPGRAGTDQIAFLLKRRLRVFRAFYPEGYNSSDPGILSKDEIRQALIEAKAVMV